MPEFETNTRWYVMTHFEMARFIDWLNTENAVRLSEGRTIIEPFYPYQYVRDFKHIAFFKATQSDIALLTSVNPDSHLQLRHYRDTNGSFATVPDAMMQDFIQACMNKSGRFEVTAPISSIEVSDKVRIMSGPFSGQEAYVQHVSLSHGVIHLDLALQLVSGMISIRMNDVSKNQVTIVERSSADAIRTDFIEYTQNNLLLILEHRVKRVTDADVNRQDAELLTRLYRYRNHEIKNESARRHFLALMLICTHLCRYKDEEDKLLAKAMDELEMINKKSESKAATDTRTYLWIALYISTNNPYYRDAAKDYVRLSKPKSDKLRRFVSLIRTGKKV